CRERQGPHARGTLAHNLIVHSPTVIEDGHDPSCVLGEIPVCKVGTFGPTPLPFAGKASRRRVSISRDHGTLVVTPKVLVADRETQGVHGIVTNKEGPPIHQATPHRVLKARGVPEDDDGTLLRCRVCAWCGGRAR